MSAPEGSPPRGLAEEPSAPPPGTTLTGLVQSLVERALTQRKVRLGASLAIAVFLGLFLWLRFTATGPLDRNGNGLIPDYSTFYAAGKMAREGRALEVYDQLIYQEETHVLFGEAKENTYFYVFLYPPFVIRTCTLLTGASYPVSAWIYFVFSLTLGTALGASVGRYFFRENPPAALTCCLLFLAAVPFWRCVLFGQNGLISLTIIWAVFRLHMSGRAVLSGMALALGLYKPQLFLGPGLWLLLCGPRRWWLGFIPIAAALVLLGTVGVGGEIWPAWIDALRRHSAVTEQYQWLHSFNNMFQLWFGRDVPEPILSVDRGLLLLLLLAWVVILWRATQRKVRPEWTAGFALLGGLLLTPRLYQYDLVMLFPLLAGWWALALQPSAPGAAPWESVVVPRFLCSRLAFYGAMLAFYVSDFAAGVKIPLLTLAGLALLLSYGWWLWRTPEASLA